MGWEAGNRYVFRGWPGIIAFHSIEMGGRLKKFFHYVGVVYVQRKVRIVTCTM